MAHVISGVDRIGRRQVIQADPQALDPLPVRAVVGQLGLDFFIINNPALIKIDEQHLARLQAPLFQDAVLGYGQGTGFGSQDDHIVIGNQVTGRTQAIAVQGCANLAAIGKCHRSRPIPGLHFGRIVLIESTTVGIHVGMLLPGLGDHHHHGMGQ